MQNLHELFERPFILTDTAAAELDFLGPANICTVQTLSENPAFPSEKNDELFTTKTSDVACLCTSSGSTGSAKGIPVQHGKMIEAAARKNARFSNKEANVFMNTACDMSLHISLSMHELPTLLCLADQVVIRNHELKRDAIAVLCLIGKHRVSNMYEVNAILKHVLNSIKEGEECLAEQIDLSSLTSITSSGEPVVMSVVDELRQKLHQLGAPPTVIRPAFGMTELCGMGTVSDVSPQYDLTNGHHFTCAGTPTRGLYLRVVDGNGRLVGAAKVGNLEVSGCCIFDGYYNNPKANEEAFTSDHWFRTGDTAKIDTGGQLHILGKTKEIIIVDGDNYYPKDLEQLLIGAGIQRLDSENLVVFGSYDEELGTELPVVVYASADGVTHDEVCHKNVRQVIANSIKDECGKEPLDILSVPRAHLARNTRGKRPRLLLRVQYERGEFADAQYTSRQLRSKDLSRL